MRRLPHANLPKLLLLAIVLAVGLGFLALPQLSRPNAGGNVAQAGGTEQAVENQATAAVRRAIAGTQVPEPVAGRAPLRAVKPPDSFRAAKRLLETEVYANASERVDFYCGCRYDADKRVDAGSCGYRPRKNETRGGRIEWEHVVPASWLGRGLQCWREGHSACVKNGKAYKGRSCCEEVDEHFQAMEADLHNLVPAVGELNADRSNYRYGEVAGEPRLYGACDFEVDFPGDVAEPAASRIGEIGRTYLYMSWRWGLPLSAQEIALYRSWDRLDPPSSWEIERDRRIARITGVSNPFMSPRGGQ